MEYHQMHIYSCTEHKGLPTLDGPIQPLFLELRHLLPPVPPPVLHLELQMTHMYNYLLDSLCDGIDHAYHRIYHSSLVQWLRNACSSTKTEVTLTLDIYFAFSVPHNYDDITYHSMCEPYMRKLLTSLGMKLTGELGVNLVIQFSGLE